MNFIFDLIYYFFYPLAWWSLWIWKFRKAKNLVAQGVIGAVAITLFVPIMFWDVIAANFVVQSNCQKEAGVKVKRSVLMSEKDLDRFGQPNFIGKEGGFRNGIIWDNKYRYEAETTVASSWGLGALPVGTVPFNPEEPYFKVELVREIRKVVDLRSSEVLGSSIHYYSTRIGPSFFRHSSECQIDRSRDRLITTIFISQK